MRCEMQGERCRGNADGWFCLDDNAELQLCWPCVKDLRAIGEKVEAIETWEGEK